MHCRLNIHFLFIPHHRWTAVHFSSAKGHKDVTQFLLSAGTNIHARTVKQVTPLMLGAYSGDIDTVQLLLQKHANVEDACDSGYVDYYINSLSNIKHLNHISLLTKDTLRYQQQH